LQAGRGRESKKEKKKKKKKKRKKNPPLTRRRKQDELSPSKRSKKDATPRKDSVFFEGNSSTGRRARGFFD
jgi:hypothetical protein